MRIPTVESSPKAYARIAGTLYLAVIVLGGFAEGYVNSRLLGAGDAAATAARIGAAPDLWRAGVAANLAVPLLAVFQLWIEFLLIRPAGRDGALLFLLLNLASLAVEAVSKVFHLLVLPILGGAPATAGLDPSLLPALADLALRAHDVAFNIALIFFGCACLVYGHLIYGSGFLPRPIGVLVQVAGLGYLVSCIAALFAPALAGFLLPGLLLLPLLGESSLCLWLLFKGVDVPRWRGAAAAARGPMAAPPEFSRARG